MVEAGAPMKIGKRGKERGTAVVEQVAQKTLPSEACRPKIV